MKWCFKYTILLVAIMLFSNIMNGKEKKLSPPDKESLNTASTYSKLCGEDDLYGLWKVERWIPYFDVQGDDWKKPAFLKNQWFIFDGKGGMKSLSSNLEIKLDDVKRKLSDLKTVIPVKFKRKGFLEIQSSNKEEDAEHWRCAIAEKDIIFKSMNIEVKKGDLLMTMFGKGNTIRFFRLLRRVEGHTAPF